VQNPVVVEVSDCSEKLQHETFDFSGQKDLLLLSHRVHQRLQIVLDKIHHWKKAKIMIGIILQ
jgi:hypothetical protein